MFLTLLCFIPFSWTSGLNNYDSLVSYCCSCNRCSCNLLTICPFSDNCGIKCSQLWEFESDCPKVDFPLVPNVIFLKWWSTTFLPLLPQWPVKVAVVNCPYSSALEAQVKKWCTQSKWQARKSNNCQSVQPVCFNWQGLDKKSRRE